MIATGGPSIPKLGASDFAYRLARQFGLKVVEPRPALVPLTLPGGEALLRCDNNHRLNKTKPKTKKNSTINVQIPKIDSAKLT